MLSLLQVLPQKKNLIITLSISTNSTSGFHCGCSFQLHDLCLESHTIGCQVTVGGCCGSQKVSGESSEPTLSPGHPYRFYPTQSCLVSISSLCTDSLTHNRTSQLQCCQCIERNLLSICCTSQKFGHAWCSNF